MTVLVQRVNYPGAMELFANQALIVGGDSTGRRCNLNVWHARSGPGPRVRRGLEAYSGFPRIHTK